MKNVFLDEAFNYLTGIWPILKTETELKVFYSDTELQDDSGNISDLLWYFKCSGLDKAMHQLHKQQSGQLLLRKFFISVQNEERRAFQPEISGRIEYSTADNHYMAVCEASNGKPNASISWSSDENVTEKVTYNWNRTFTVESRRIIPNNTSMGNVTCKVSHPYWNESQTYTVPYIRDTAQEPNKPFYWIVIIACLFCVLLIIFVTSFVCIKKHLADLRNCCKSTIPVATAPTKTQVCCQHSAGQTVLLEDPDQDVDERNCWRNRLQEEPGKVG
ncbi:UNVERIFIED_CONTAM: hypothetical protein FKN15_077094 [Acipenser sinensis]